MGRLFWKFFLIFWLAQVITSFGVGLAIWGEHTRSVSRLHGASPAPPAEPFSPPPPGPPALRAESDVVMTLARQEGIFPPLLPILAGSVVSLVFAALLAWYFARPIRNLREAFEAVASGRLDTRIGLSMEGWEDELSDLGEDFDRMACRLQKLMESKRRLLHDISHELRSPLARVQAAVDLMQQQPERAPEFVSHLERDAERIDRLVGELLMLERLDSGMAGRMDETVDLYDLLDHIAGDARFEAQSRQCSVDLDASGPACVKGSQELLFRALENVVRNAVLHSPSGGHVEITVRWWAGQWVVIVSDEGPGVPEAELETIFEPFTRGKPNSSYTGYGLGLAITRRVVEAHGGSVTAANRVGRGLRMTIALPASPAESADGL